MNIFENLHSSPLHFFFLWEKKGPLFISGIFFSSLQDLNSDPTSFCTPVPPTIFLIIWYRSQEADFSSSQCESEREVCLKIICTRSTSQKKQKLRRIIECESDNNNSVLSHTMILILMSIIASASKQAGRQMSSHDLIFDDAMYGIHQLHITFHGQPLSTLCRIFHISTDGMEPKLSGWLADVKIPFHNPMELQFLANYYNSHRSYWA